MRTDVLNEEVNGPPNLVLPRLTYELPPGHAGFTQVPNALLHDARLSATARLLYGLLRDYSWRYGMAWPGQTRLAADLGLRDPKQARHYARELQRSGLLVMERRGLGLTNYYYVWQPPEPDAPPPAANLR